MKIPGENIILEIKEYPKYPNEIGKKFGYLEVLYEVELDESIVLYMLKCKCGKELLRHRSTLIHREKYGKIQSCSCYQKEQVGLLKKTHGYASGKKERLYKIWTGMRDRCNNPRNQDYHHYGGKGIKVCKKWNDYEKFRKWAIGNGYSKKLTIDRINGDKGYSPGNCQWITREAQCRNTTQNSRFLINGEWFLLVDLSKKLGVGIDTIHRMANDGRLKYDQWIKPTSGRYYNKNTDKEGRVVSHV